MFESRMISCPVCGADAFSVVGYRGGTAHPRGLGERTRIVKCKSCKHRYPNPYPFPVSLAEVYGDADEYFKEFSHEEMLSTRVSTIAWLERVNGDAKGRLLDIGAGRGEMVHAATQRGWDATGVEPVPAFVAAAKAKYNIDLINGYFDPSAFTSGSFNAVILSAVLEHVPDPAPLLTGIRSVLAPGGLLFLDIPNEASLPFKLGNLYYRLRGRDWTMNLAPTFPPYHVQGFGRNSIRVLLKNTGFSIAAYRTYAGTVLDHRPGVSAAIERWGFSTAARLAEVAGDAPYIELVAKADMSLQSNPVGKTE